MATTGFRDFRNIYVIIVDELSIRAGKNHDFFI